MSFFIVQDQINIVLDLFISHKGEIESKVPGPRLLPDDGVQKLIATKEKEK